ncbi:PREDICTED: DNA polymerase subunit gamma-2, mitochondrial isoform X2 [Ceratosolen solmsi marchali]|uniref:DNA polymerase subunit gamma-2, mitochondrial isoform X2 n=1 Tax=Ceratosolen solmsi marchali TaxID=326594 RepID=A0AAJ6YF09_9HYME|nr:PREDICTED: DNA polymerase subunit gamma-2, mitochondrial isoform X2 [Ceratosolen solmsi marchali]
MEQILKVLGPSFLTLKEFGFAYGMQDIGLNNVPFGIANIDNVKNIWNKSINLEKNVQHRIAKITTVYESDDAIGSVKDLFYKKQRERKSWWRQISENPSIYHIREGEQKRGEEHIEIEAQFPFGNIVVEKIHFKKNASAILPGISKTSNLRIVEHITSLDWACLTILCDGYIEIEGSKELQIHPQLSPYKAYCKANISPEDDDIVKEDLNDLTLYVIELLREKGVESVIMNNVKKPEVFRVPYIITVNNESLKSGLVKLVCQRTLCGETVHITDMAQRMYNLCV